ncbi:MAG: hypothetical protein K9J79_08795 [Desulfobacteraceae bacterium]|nr:hypothetical protein [Desulfobacteraceae bacterium]
MIVGVVTAIYPAVLTYLKDFAESLENQTDPEFELWIGLDGLDEKDIKEAAGRKLAAHFVDAPKNTTPAVVRNTVLQQALQNCEAAVLVDADDILMESRVAAAKASAGGYDLTATAMRFIDAARNPVEGVFDPDRGDPCLARNNVYGFSNTTWRAEILMRCLPVPAECVLMDWFAATLAYYKGASIGHDPKPRMYYRQHADNIASILPPFTKSQIARAAQLVLGHYDLMLQTLSAQEFVQLGELSAARAQTAVFADAIADPALLEEYVDALNALPARHVWWSCVAHPDLEDIWKK